MICHFGISTSGYQLVFGTWGIHYLSTRLVIPCIGGLTVREFRFPSWQLGSAATVPSTPYVSELHKHFQAVWEMSTSSPTLNRVISPIHALGRSHPNRVLTYTLVHFVKDGSPSKDVDTCIYGAGGPPQFRMPGPGSFSLLTLYYGPFSCSRTA